MQIAAFCGLQGFLFKEGLPLVDRIDLSSNFREPGNNCYMRETVGYALIKCAQEDSLYAFSSGTAVLSTFTSIPLT